MPKSTTINRNALELISKAIAARAALFDSDHNCPLRLFNGFYEGNPDLVIDLFGRTLVIFNYADDPARSQALINASQALILERLPWIKAVLIKTRQAVARDERTGRLVYGETPDDRVREHGIWYAIDLQMNQDESFYLDTRNLRAWLNDKLRGRSFLNTFAYTGSLGAAALVGGASRVIQTDRSRKFLDLARKTYALNEIDTNPEDFPIGDFHRLMGQFKKEGRLFDCVVLDPPYFSETTAGRVDLAAETQRLVNKVRPLVAHEGWLVVVNNALFLSGKDFLADLENLCQDGYLRVESILPVPADVAGYPETRAAPPPADPTPFNHPTKIVVLRVKRKDQAKAN